MNCCNSPQFATHETPSEGCYPKYYLKMYLTETVTLKQKKIKITLSFVGVPEDIATCR
jgi:hypothetical protein